jgi:hypothetical protein
VKRWYWWLGSAQHYCARRQPPDQEHGSAFTCYCMSCWQAQEQGREHKQGREQQGRGNAVCYLQQ